MITKEEKIEIFENMISSLRKKFVPSDKIKSDIQEVDCLTEKFRRLPLD